MESGTLVAPRQPPPAKSPVKAAARQQRSPRKAQPADIARVSQPLPQQMHLLAQLQAAQEQHRVQERQRQQELWQQERQQQDLLLERQHALAQLQLAALQQQQLAAPPPSHSLQSSSLALAGEQRSWPLVQLSGPAAAQQQQHQAQLVQQLIAAGRLASHTADGLSPRGHASSAVEAAYAAASAMQVCCMTVVVNVHVNTSMSILH